MPLWGSVDNAANSVISVVQQVNLPVSEENRDALYANTLASEFVTNVAVGVFGVDAQEQQAVQHDPRGAHAGWVLRTEGTGGRAGRVFVETLVAMGSMTEDGTDDDQFPEYSIQILVHPQGTTVNANTTLALTVSATALPEGTEITYQWQANGANLSDAGIYSGTDTDTLEISDTTDINANSYGVIVYAGDVFKLSANAVIYVIPE
jgi:hypothetical protein